MAYILLLALLLQSCSNSYNPSILPINSQENLSLDEEEITGWEQGSIFANNATYIKQQDKPIIPEKDLSTPLASPQTEDIPHTTIIKQASQLYLESGLITALYRTIVIKKAQLQLLNQAREGLPIQHILQMTLIL